MLGALTLGCSGASQAVDDAATVHLGAGALQSVEFDHSMTLEVDRIPDCLDFNATLESTRTTVELSNSPAGCMLTVEQPDLQLLDEQAVDRARKQSGNFDPNGIRRAGLDVMQFELSTAKGEPIPLAQYFDTLTIIVDGQAALDHVAIAQLEAGDLSCELPEELVAKLKTALKDKQPANADVAIALGIHSGAVLPDSLELRVVLQPELWVNVVDAVL